MQSRSKRFSRRHLLALGTFLVPLALLAVLGWDELRRSGESAEASLEREARQFLNSARQNIEQRIDLQVASALGAAEKLLAEYSPTRTALRLRNEEGITSALDVLLLDEQGGLVSPTLPTFTVSLPFVREPQDGVRGRRMPKLSEAEALLAHGEYQAAIYLLTDLAETLTRANPVMEDGSHLWRRDYLEAEVHARFRLAAALRAIGKTNEARAQFLKVEKLSGSTRGSFRRSTDMAAIQLLALSAMADLGPPEDRLDLLRSIAEDEHSFVADGLAGAIAERLAATFQESDPRRPEVDRFLLEENQRAGTREFAGSYELLLRRSLGGRMLSLFEASGSPAERPEQRVIERFVDHTLLLALRLLPEEQQHHLQAAFVAVHLDLDVLLQPAFDTFVRRDGNYVLAVAHAGGGEILPKPNDTPSSFEAPFVEASGLVLRAYPADIKRLVAEADSARTTRIMLGIALLVAAICGALWSWRSVSRETELADMKIDLVSRVSHELKTPLALIRMYGETLGMGRARDGEQTREFGSIIARESERLTTLIQRILDFSRQQAGTLTYSTAHHDLGELLREMSYAYAPHLMSKGVVLIDSLPLGITAPCDKDGLEGAIINLLENAAKYGRDGDDEHEVDLLLEKQGDLAVIEVRDLGRGIPDGEHDSVFEGFYRASNSGEVRGAGLGLGIVQHFARAHGGDIVALPRKGGGTIMRMTLPIRSAASPSAGMPAYTPADTPADPTKKERTS
ncbi:MAG: sensor histidine kinase [Planctomycetota bacterium]